MNMNDVAVAVTKAEGGSKNLDIAQVKEVIKVLGDLIAADPQMLLVVCRHWSLKRDRRTKKSKFFTREK